MEGVVFDNCRNGNINTVFFADFDFYAFTHINVKLLCKLLSNYRTAVCEILLFARFRICKVDIIRNLTRLCSNNHIGFKPGILSVSRCIINLHMFKHCTFNLCLALYCFKGCTCAECGVVRAAENNLHIIAPYSVVSNKLLVEGSID